MKKLKRYSLLLLIVVHIQWRGVEKEKYAFCEYYDALIENCDGKMCGKYIYYYYYYYLSMLIQIRVSLNVFTKEYRNKWQKKMNENPIYT